MQKICILVVEDEEDIAHLVQLQGELNGYKMLVEFDGISGLRTAIKEKPDLVLLDIMLPGQSGLDVCRKIKNNPETKDIPVIMLSAKTEEIDVVLGLELGADDYVAKPFSPKILFSRIKAVLRRGKEEEEEKIGKALSFGPFQLDIERYLLTKNDKEISLTLSEFGILRRLALHRGKVLTRNQLLDDVHNEEAFIVDRNIDVHIASLRKKLGPQFTWIQTVRGLGYRFKEEE